MYEEGHGVDRSLEKAVEYYLEAAEKGETYAADYLNQLAEEGKITADYKVIPAE